MFKKFAVLTLSLVLLTACAPEAVLPTRPGDSTPAPPSGSFSAQPYAAVGGLNGSLSIAAAEVTHMERYVDAFTAIYPDVAITVSRRGGNSAKANMDYATAVATEIMSGQGDDLIYTDYLPYVQYAHRGMLVDLNEFLEKDPDLKADFYGQVLTAKTVFDGIYALPTALILPSYAAGNTYVQQIEELLITQTTLDYRQAIAAFEAIREGAPGLLYPGSYFTVDTLLEVELPRFYDLAEKRVEFGQEFIDMVNEIAPYAANPYALPTGGQYLFDMFQGIGSTINVKGLLQGASSRSLPCADTTGRTMLWSLGNSYAINANSENKELAWEFLKFMSSAEGRIAAGTVDQIPLRKSVLYGTIGETSALHNVDETDLWAAADFLNALLEQPCQITDADPFRMDVTQSAFQDYIDGLLTAEQLAARLQEKLTLYVNQ